MLLNIAIVIVLLGIVFWIIGRVVPVATQGDPCPKCHKLTNGRRDPCTCEADEIADIMDHYKFR